MRLLAPGWLLYQDQWVMRAIPGYGGSVHYIDAALIDRVTGAIYILSPGFSIATIERALGREAT